MDQNLGVTSGGIRPYGVMASAPHGHLREGRDLDDGDVAQIAELVQAMADLREAERRASQASARYMDLNETDMRAIRFVMFNENRGVSVTAGDLSAHLGISTASTTKLLDRLQARGHIVRNPHPTDRRSLQISVTPETRRVARDTVGRHHARRYEAAARLTPSEREVVIRFLRETTEAIDLKNADWMPHE
ncbi:MarR family winged helix-turn-helix transcriptional regulator [Propioniciclava flava]|nr:MarR family transcriptional regulator [Propioniciclava flava]